MTQLLSWVNCLINPVFSETLAALFDSFAHNSTSGESASKLVRK